MWNLIVPRNKEIKGGKGRGVSLQEEVSLPPCYYFLCSCHGETMGVKRTVATQQNKHKTLLFYCPVLFQLRVTVRSLITNQNMKFRRTVRFMVL